MVNLFSFGCHVIDRAYVRTYLTAVKRSSMRNALVSGPGRGNFLREILIETIAETGVKQSIVEQSSEMR